jgi:hypothetical protein
MPLKDVAALRLEMRRSMTRMPVGQPLIPTALRS